MCRKKLFGSEENRDLLISLISLINSIVSEKEQVRAWRGKMLMAESLEGLFS